MNSPTAPSLAAAAPHPQTAPDAPISCKEQFSHTFPLEVELVRIPSDTIPHISESANDGSFEAVPSLGVLTEFVNNVRCSNGEVRL